MKNLKEIAALRWQVVIMFAAVVIALGYLGYFVFKFYKNATAFVDRHAYDEPEDEQPEPAEPVMSANGSSEPEPAKHES